MTTEPENSGDNMLDPKIVEELATNILAAKGKSGEHTMIEPAPWSFEGFMQSFAELCDFLAAHGIHNREELEARVKLFHTQAGASVESTPEEKCSAVHPVEQWPCELSPHEGTHVNHTHKLAWDWHFSPVPLAERPLCGFNMGGGLKCNEPSGHKPQHKYTDRTERVGSTQGPSITLPNWQRMYVAEKEGRLLASQQVSGLRDALERLQDREWVGRIMHELWSKTKRVQGFHGPDEACLACMPPFGGIARRKEYIRCSMFHADLIPWEQLPEAQKDINLHAFDGVLAQALAASPAGRRRMGMQNKTDDGYALDDTYRLIFTLISVHNDRGRGVGADVGWNQSVGKKRPYLIAWIGRITLQSGWLFDTPALPAPTSPGERK